MLPDRVSNPGPLTYESGALPIALRCPADESFNLMILVQLAKIKRNMGYFGIIRHPISHYHKTRKV